MRATPTKEPALTPASVRCAIYTRKSTEEGLQQEFNSLDAQREAAEAYVKSQAAEGWACLPARYDDGGFTGGNMDRPPCSASSPTSGKAPSTRPWPTKSIA